MKKIMFNDRYGLTQAVIEWRKIMTRRIIEPHPAGDYHGVIEYTERGTQGFYRKFDFTCGMSVASKYHIGEIVAVAQSYKDLGYSDFALDRDPKDVQHVRGTLKQSAGWNNKLFVRAEACKHQIRITGIRCERLQDISDEDCLREGISEAWYESTDTTLYGYADEKKGTAIEFDSPRKAFASLIDKVSGKGTWDGNPWVFVYEFELLG